MDEIEMAALAHVTGAGPAKPMFGPFGMSVRRPPQTPGVPRYGMEQCLTCGAERWAREMAKR